MKRRMILSKTQAELNKIRRRNIPRNAAMADKQYARENRLSEAPEKVKRLHRKMFENAEYERERGK